MIRKSSFLFNLMPNHNATLNSQSLKRHVINLALTNWLQKEC